MSNRRFEMFEYRHALVRMRLGESDRQIAKTHLMGRRKLAQVREIALNQGWLALDTLLPNDAELSLALSGRAPVQSSTSSIIPFQGDVRDWVKQGIAGIAIHMALTGKSHIAQALGDAGARNGYEVLFVTVGKLLGMLQATKATNSYERKLSTLAKTDLLIIDDFVLKPFKTSEDEDFHDLIAERYERCPTIITSNLDFSEWGEAFNNKLLGAATLDRMRHGAYKVVLEGRSFRSSREEATLKNRVAGAGKNE